MQGWVSIHRKMQEHWLWQEERVFSKAEAWIDLLLSVNHTDNKIVIKNKVINVKRGQTAMSLVTLAKRWKWDKSKVRRFLEVLKSDTMIDTQNETVTTLITICNYESYQVNGNGSETKKKRKRNGSETHSTPNNNDNNENNDNNYKGICVFAVDSDKLDLAKMYIDYRKEGRKKFTQRAFDLITEDINSHSVAECDYVIKKTIKNGWTGLFWDNIPTFATEDKIIRDSYGSAVGQRTTPEALAKYYGITVEEAKKMKGIY